MSYRPKHPLIVVVNADGSGYTLQFSTLAEAKTAHSSIVTDGVAYLYSSSKNSLSSGDGYVTIPEYNNGMTYGTGALVRLNGVVYQLINFIGAGGYGPITHSYAWTTNVVIPPALPPISSTGSTDGARRGMTFTTAQNISFTPPACPSAGTILEEANTSSIIIPIYGQQIQVGTTVYNLVADGACDSYEVTTSVGYVPNGTLVASDETNNYFSNGEGGYYLEAKPPSPPTIVGYQGDEDHLITALFNVVNRTRTRAQYSDGSYGEWSEWNYTAYGTYYGNDDFNNYYSDGAGSFYSEAKPVCEDSGLHENGVNGWTYDGCHWSYDSRWNCDPSDLHINEAGWTYDGCLWSYTNPCDDANAHTNGQEGWTYDGCHWSYDDRWNCEDVGLHTGEAGWTYDGCHWSYVEPCPSSGTTLSNDSGYNYVDVGCGNFATGTWGTTTYADGNCGSYTSGGGSYYGSGTFIGNCNNYNYRSDGNGGYYQDEYTGPQCEDATAHISGEGGWTYDGCHWSYVEPPPPCTEANTLLSESNMSSFVNVGCGDFTIGNNYDRVFADGACGTYNVTGTDWVGFEVVIGYCDDHTYYSDGNGGYLSS